MGSKSLYLKIVVGDWRSASRDKRELRVAENLGYEVVVIATTKDSKDVLQEYVDGFKVIRIPTRKYGFGKIQIIFGRIQSFFVFIQEVKKIKADIISGHNYSGWIIGYLAHKKKVKYIYDCHEYELYQKDRNILAFHFVKAIERFVLGHSSINMVVTDSIADAVQKIYKLSERPLVIRNIPEKSYDNFVHKEEYREEFHQHLNISDNGFIIMHHGGFAPGRGIEESIKATARLNDVGLVLMGYALNEDYKKSIYNLAERLHCADRVYIKAAVPFSELYENISASDVGIVIIQNTCQSFFYCLPNKLLEYIQALTPVIGSDFPEIGKIIEHYQIGIKIRPDDIDALVEAVKFMRSNKKQYNYYKENLRLAKEELCWENEREKLKRAIDAINCKVEK